MPGRLAEKMGLATLELNPEHFRMLRLAILRRLTCDQLTPNLFLVSSSREGHGPYEVDAVRLTCPCDSTSYCSHVALALDRWMQREADVQTGGDYFTARRLDFGGLPGKKDLHSDDRRYLKVCVERAREKYAHLFTAPESAEATF